MTELVWGCIKLMFVALLMLVAVALVLLAIAYAPDFVKKCRRFWQPCRKFLEPMERKLYVKKKEGIMRGRQLLKNNQEISAIFLTPHMTEAEVKPYVCPQCRHCGADVIRYEGKIGGSDQPVTITACNDLVACLLRQEKNK